ncbi:AAA ATPase midasin, partial [Spiromyces aspiralis]
APDTGDAIRLAVTQSQELAEQFASVNRLLARANALFEWRDGPLVQAMKSGDLFLLDEISLADDSVLERLNSILETSRSLMLAEDASGNGESIVAAPNFEFLATMNPGGDYGKRELSPALRNRFTELWVPAISSRADLELILYERLWDRIQAMGHGYSQGKELDLSKEAVGRIVRELLDYVMWLAKTLVPGLSGGGDESELLSVISLRDYLAWTDFIARTHGWLGVAGSFAHGGCLVILDGIGSHSALGGAFGSYQMRRKVKARCVDELLRAARSLVGGSEPFAHDEPVGALVGIVEAAKLVQEGRVAVKSAFELGRLVEFAPKVDGAATG